MTEEFDYFTEVDKLGAKSSMNQENQENKKLKKLPDLSLSMLATLKFPIKYSEFESRFGWNFNYIEEIEDRMRGNFYDPSNPEEKDDLNWYNSDPKYKDCALVPLLLCLIDDNDELVYASMVLKATTEPISLKEFGCEPDEEFDWSFDNIILEIGKENAYKYWCSFNYEIIEMSKEDLDKYETSESLVNQ